MPIDSSIPEDTIGYAGVIIVPKVFYQGFYLRQGHVAAGQAFLDRILPELQRDLDKDQVLHALCASFAAACELLEEALIPEISQAIRLFSGADYYLIHVTPEEGERKGYSTYFERLAVTSPLEARDRINAHPATRLIKVLQLLRRTAPET